MTAFGFQAQAHCTCTYFYSNRSTNIYSLLYDAWPDIPAVVTAIYYHKRLLNGTLNGNTDITKIILSRNHGLVHVYAALEYALGEQSELGALWRGRSSSLNSRCRRVAY